MQVMKLAARAYLAERKNRELMERLKDLNMELEEKVRRRTAQIREAMQELQQKNRTLEKLALTDALTGLPNRMRLEPVISHALRNAAENGEEWITHGHDYAETHFSPLKQIDSTNVKQASLRPGKRRPPRTATWKLPCWFRME